MSRFFSRTSTSEPLEHFDKITEPHLTMEMEFADSTLNSLVHDNLSNNGHSGVKLSSICSPGVSRINFIRRFWYRPTPHRSKACIKSSSGMSCLPESSTACRRVLTSSTSNQPQSCIHEQEEVGAEIVSPRRRRYSSSSSSSRTSRNALLDQTVDASSDDNSSDNFPVRFITVMPLRNDPKQLYGEVTRVQGNSTNTYPPSPATEVSSSQQRQRFNSREIPTTYAGQYGSVDTDLLPLECMRVHTINPTIFLGGYATFIMILHGISFVLVTVYAALFSRTSQDVIQINNTITATTVIQLLINFWHNVSIDSWTVTNFFHLAMMMEYIHWSKGRDSFLLLSGRPDEQGEMNAMTVWEQLESVPDSVAIRHILLVVPTVITYFACVSADFQKEACFINIIIWLISMLAKLPCMHGVRLFGINRTAGIDDDEPYVFFDNKAKSKFL